MTIGEYSGYPEHLLQVVLALLCFFLYLVFCALQHHLTLLFVSIRQSPWIVSHVQKNNQTFQHHARCLQLHVSSKSVFASQQSTSQLHITPRSSLQKDYAIFNSLD
jgi:hypothetical protein